MTASLRLAQLRAALVQQEADACLIPSADPHLSEYLPEHWQGREWLSGFTGSAGLLLVTRQEAGVWTDSRYWEQAERELAGSGIALLKQTAGQPQGYLQWLVERVPEGGSVLVDGQVLALGMAAALRRACESKGIRVRTDLDPLAALWPDRPPLPSAAIYEHRAPFAAQPRSAKLAQVREALAEAGADWHFVSSLDDIAWLLNLRGADVPYNPVFLAHLLLSRDSCQLFIDAAKVPGEVKSALAADGVELLDYTAAAAHLAALPAGATLLVDPVRVTLGLAEAAPAGVQRIEQINPSTLFKACKSEAEIAQVRLAMEEDGAALCEFFARFEAALTAGEALTELTVDEWLSAARAARPNFVSLSFATIAGYNAGGALPHYRATEEAHARLEGDGLLLIDSGGQYLGGTTDITRVVPIGTPSAAQRRDFTLVLKGMLALSQARFPSGVAGPQLDALARAPIWAAGIDYGHGTGHGVGYFLNVHEGPQNIAYSTVVTPHHRLRPGMITSNEPGIYRPGQWGVRLENLLLCVPAERTPFGDFLAFETLTLCPLDTRCLDLALLREDELAWLDAYHAEVRARVLPKVVGAARDWLLARTEPVARAVA